MGISDRRVALLSLILLPGLLLVGCPGEVPQEGSSAVEEEEKKPTVAFVTNGIASFWVIAEAGAQQAAEEFDVNLEVRMPPDGVGDQKRMVEELLTMEVDGIAISPINPENQMDLLNQAGEQTILITHDSDAPDSNRLCYVGMSNYDAGRMCGELVKEAMPEGGSVMIFVGRVEQDNARLRRQGVIDELMNRSYDPDRFDVPGEVIEAPGESEYVILGTRTDNFDFAAAKALAENALSAHADLGCMVGLFAYNPPYMLEALKGAGREGEVKLIGFDEEDGTLQAIQDGHCYGTIVQNPYMYGHESVRILAGLARGDESVLPEGGFLDTPAQKITAENVDAFWAELKERIGQDEVETGETSGE